MDGIEKRRPVNITESTCRKIRETRLPGDSPVLFPGHREHDLILAVDLIIEPRGQMVPVCVGALSCGAVGAVLRLEPVETTGVQTVRSIGWSALVIVRRRHVRQVILSDKRLIDSCAVGVFHIAKQIERTHRRRDQRVTARIN